MDIISPHCSITRATDEVASFQLQTVHRTTVSMEGSDQFPSESIPHLVQCTRQYCTALCDSTCSIYPCLYAPVYMATVGAGSVCTYMQYVCDELWEIYYIHHIAWYVSQVMHFCITFPVVCNNSTHDCTLIVLSTDPEMMVVSLTSTAYTSPSCP